MNAALSGFFHDIHRRIAAAIPAEIRNRMDNLLVVPAEGVVSGFETMQHDPGKPDVENLQAEIDRLRAI